MKIQQLFDELEKIKETSKLDFEKSGMVNRFKEMKYGFFPLGWGILDENNKTDGSPTTDEIDEGGVMVLGNDFGTVNYVEKDCNDIGETEGKTVNNLIKRAMLDTYKTFFTNFYLGVRLDDGLYCGTTMTKRMYDGKVNKLKNCYKNLCNDFFKIQLELIKPRIVICLGHEVKNALIDSGISFHKWKPKTGSFEKLYAMDGARYIVENMELNGIKFIIIPHPSYLVNLLKPPYLEKLNAFLKSN